MGAKIGMSNFFSRLSKTLLFVFLSLMVCTIAFSATRGLRLQIKDNSGTPSQQINLYEGSYALLVGGSNYTAGWASLESVPQELAEVERLLKLKGFHVEKHLDPDHKQIGRVFENFIHKYGYAPSNRLLFYYSGHGYTRKDGRKGYLVPVDAPNPTKDEFGFISKSLSMNQILFWARDIEAKHAIFLFDSCFSGTIFKHRELPRPPKHITKLTTLPVRQFITAGMAGETVPAVSTFTPAFIDGLLYNLADLNGDGYVSGTELGLYLQEKVPQYTNQTPQFGKIADYELSRGDFIFVAGGGVSIKPQETVEKKDTVASKGELKVTSNPAGAQVYFNGQKVGITPVQFGNIDEGDIEVTVTKNKYKTVKQTASITAGRRTVLNFDMPLEVQTGKLTLRIEPSNTAIRFLRLNTNYSPGMEIAPGKYTLVLSAPGYLQLKRSITILPSEHLLLHLGLTPVKQPEPPQSEVVTQPKISSPVQHSAKIQKKNKRLIQYIDGMIEDRKMKIMWPNTDNGEDITWQDAYGYCRKYRGGGYSDWRMPTVSELKELHSLKSKNDIAASSVSLTKSYVWSSLSNGKKAAFYYFDTGNQLWFPKTHSQYLRVLPVRSIGE